VILPFTEITGIKFPKLGWVGITLALALFSNDPAQAAVRDLTLGGDEMNAVSHENAVALCTNNPRCTTSRTGFWWSLTCLLKCCSEPNVDWVLPMKLKNLLARVDGDFEIDEALADWRWLVSEHGTPLLVTAFGDLFFVASSGAAMFLDTIAGTCTEVAESVDVWKQHLQNAERIDEWFMPGLLVVLHEAGVYLSQGECYAAKHAVILGGSLTTDNWKPMHWRVHFAVSGQLHEQVKKLPPGTEITNVKYDPL
jgi:hypothetical protein